MRKRHHTNRRRASKDGVHAIWKIGIVPIQRATLRLAAFVWHHVILKILTWLTIWPLNLILIIGFVIFVLALIFSVAFWWYV